MNRAALVWVTLRASLWFVPATIVAACVVLAVVLIEVDAAFDPEFLRRFPRLFGAGAEGTRGMLSAIAGAMITVAGVVFSVTIVALSLTSSQYTSRALRNFTGDRSNQVVLGAFVGIYAYCLVVLRTIRDGDSSGFVPSLATLGGVVLAFVGIALLIHFIHHISRSIQASHILAAIHTDTCRVIDRLYPEPLGSRADADDRVAATTAIREDRASIAATKTGYIQNVDASALVALTRRSDVVIWLPHSIGDFVFAGACLAEVAGVQGDCEAIAKTVRRAVAIGPQRTSEQDISFGLRQIVDIALKALSPAINDPTTACTCLDYLSALVGRLAQRDFPSRYRSANGTLRIIASRPSFARLVEEAFEEVRLASATNPIVMRTLMIALSSVVDAARGNTTRRAAALALLARVREDAARLTDVTWRNRLTALADQAMAGEAVHASRRSRP